MIYDICNVKLRVVYLFGSLNLKWCDELTLKTTKKRCNFRFFIEWFCWIIKKNWRKPLPTNKDTLTYRFLNRWVVIRSGFFWNALLFWNNCYLLKMNKCFLTHLVYDFLKESMDCSLIAYNWMKMVVHLIWTF
jgi:hypothetical protein